MGGVLQRSISIVGPLDLRATLRPLHGRFTDRGWWLTSRTPGGPATLLVTRSRDQLNGTAWGPGGEILLDRLGQIAGLDDDPSSFHTDHPVVSDLSRRNPGARFGRTGEVVAELITAIVGQKVTGTEAGRAMHGLTKVFSGPAPGPFAGPRLPPDPELLARAPYWRFHEIHLEKRRADLLRSVAGRWRAIEALADSTVPAAGATLAGIPGVGKWTVAETLSRSHGDPDLVSVGDFHLKNMVVFHLTGRPRGSDEEMMALLEEFKPNRGRVVRLLHTLGHAPKYGPRLAPRNIASI